MQSTKSHSLLPGMLLVLACAVPAWFLGKVIPLLGGAVIGILLGMVVRSLFQPKQNSQPGIEFAGKHLL
jgi:uncharacterized membrane protein YadS